jgi:hypothetical protein
MVGFPGKKQKYENNGSRVTGRVFEKAAKNIAKLFFVKINPLLVQRKKVCY